MKSSMKKHSIFWFSCPHVSLHVHYDRPSIQSCSVSKEKIGLTFTKGTLWSDNSFKSANIIIRSRNKASIWTNFSLLIEQLCEVYKNWRKILWKHGCVFLECSFRNDFTPFQNNHQTSRQTAIFILCPTLWIIFKIKYILREIHCCTAGVIHPTNSSLSSFRIMLWTTVQWDVFLLIVRN